MAVGEQTRQIRHHLRVICADVGTSGEVGRSSEAILNVCKTPERGRARAGPAPCSLPRRRADVVKDREPCTQV
jgi:hypothetical protein